jgi:hypothetical protein
METTQEKPMRPSTERLAFLHRRLKRNDRLLFEAEEDPEGDLEQVAYWQQQVHEAAAKLAGEISANEAIIKDARSTLAAVGYPHLATGGA